MHVFVQSVFHGVFFITISYFLGEMRVVPIISKMINSSERIFKKCKGLCSLDKNANLKPKPR